MKTFIQGIRDWLKANSQAKPEFIIKYLNPLLRGWGNYYRHGVSKRVFNYVDDQIWKALWRWCRRRHPNKGRKWIAGKLCTGQKHNNPLKVLLLLGLGQIQQDVSEMVKTIAKEALG